MSVRTCDEPAARSPLGVWGTGRVMAKAFSEQATCLRAVYALAERSGTLSEKAREVKLALPSTEWVIRYE